MCECVRTCMWVCVYMHVGVGVHACGCVCTVKLLKPYFLGDDNRLTRLVPHSYTCELPLITIHKRHAKEVHIVSGYNAKVALLPLIVVVCYTCGYCATHRAYHATIEQ